MNHAVNLDTNAITQRTTISSSIINYINPSSKNIEQYLTIIIILVQLFFATREYSEYNIQSSVRSCLYSNAVMAIVAVTAYIVVVTKIIVSSIVPISVDVALAYIKVLFDESERFASVIGRQCCQSHFTDRRTPIRAWTI
jgi:hypothetical protein